MRSSSHEGVPALRRRSQTGLSLGGTVVVLQRVGDPLVDGRLAAGLEVEQFVVAL